MRDSQVKKSLKFLQYPVIKMLSRYQDAIPWSVTPLEHAKTESRPKIQPFVANDTWAEKKANQSALIKQNCFKHLINVLMRSIR